MEILGWSGFEAGGWKYHKGKGILPQAANHRILPAPAILLDAFPRARDHDESANRPCIALTNCPGAVRIDRERNRIAAVSVR